MDTKGIQRTFVVSFDHAQGEVPILIVGETTEKGIMDIVSAHHDREAIDIYKALIGAGKNESNV